MGASSPESTKHCHASRGAAHEPIRLVFGVGSLTGLSDGDLLRKFTDEEGVAAETAFATLVERHGPMVLGVCRAVLADHHHAEDACQAAFLVLARRARAIRRGDAVANWLYSTARRIALRDRRRAARQRATERHHFDHVAGGKMVTSPPSDSWTELYEELDRLPQPFRAAVVLCDLEGRSYEQAAAMLQCPIGTIQSRLSRGRERLRGRLIRRGFTSAVSTAGAASAVRSTSAAMPPGLAAAIARAAIRVVGGQSIASVAPQTVAVLAVSEVRRLVMTRALTVLTAFMLTGFAAAATIGLAIAGMQANTRSRGTDSAARSETGPLHIRVVNVPGEGAAGIRVDLSTLDPMPLGPAGEISGTVTYATTGKPVAGATVAAQIIEYPREVHGRGGEAVADAQGRFTISGLDPGVYNLLFERAPGHERDTAAAVEGLRVRAGANTPASLSVIEGRTVRGVVIDQKTDRPVAGASVGCHGPARPNSGAAVETATTDEHGAFLFHVPPGDQRIYIMEVTAPSRLSQRRIVVPDQGDVEAVHLLRMSPATSPTGYVAKAQVLDAMKVQVQPNPPAALQRKEKAAGARPKSRTVTGRVRDRQGRPLFGLRVQVSPRLPEPGVVPETFDIAATDREGMFVLEGLPQRELEISLNEPYSSFEVKTLPANTNEIEWTYRPPANSTNPRAMAASVDEPVPDELRRRLTFVDLGRYGNDALADGPGGGGNDLDRMPRGVHKWGKAYFQIGEMMVHVQSQVRPQLPQSIKGIKIGARGRVVHFLHATQYDADSGEIVGAYLIHYDDETSVTVPMIYDRTLSNWWKFAAQKADPAHDQVAWTGSNQSTDLNPGLSIRLFATAWTNPHPEKIITALDMLSAGKRCDPFLVAVTLERD
jgi:RNA polymerase sigma factor (sigma-70 family)